jgi:hypothetical protein
LTHGAEQPVQDESLRRPEADAQDVGYDSGLIEAGSGAQFDMNLNVLCH